MRAPQAMRRHMPWGCHQPVRSSQASQDGAATPPRGTPWDPRSQGKPQAHVASAHAAGHEAATCYGVGHGARHAMGRPPHDAVASLQAVWSPRIMGPTCHGVATSLRDSGRDMCAHVPMPRPHPLCTCPAQILTPAALGTLSSTRKEAWPTGMARQKKGKGVSARLPQLRCCTKPLFQ